MSKEHDQPPLNNPESQAPKDVLLTFINELSRERKEIGRTHQRAMEGVPEPFKQGSPDVYALAIAIEKLVEFGKKAGYLTEDVEARDLY